ncbi:cytochrome P450 [Acuticoccus sp. 2012]|uniref:Cytochrome P450 n=2 Tax=Acuticoccus mangrovi TaxID=2796142 RepID=A0A934IU95_9HYPH|nr:cytochrome P450 [Acuticoccus mangrovi]MBJ3778155.1 cytochrome P450 [Acuticoccus mangrovi]
MTGAEDRSPRSRPRHLLPPGPRLPGIIQLLCETGVNWRYLQLLRRRFGPVFTMTAAFHEPVVVVSSPETARRVFALTRDDFTHANATSSLEGAMDGRSIFFIDRADHQAIRRALAVPFSRRHVAGDAAPLHDLIRRAVAKLPERGPVALVPFGERLATCVVVALIFGGAADDPRNEALADLAVAGLERSGSFLERLSVLVPPLQRLAWLNPYKARHADEAGRFATVIAERVAARRAEGPSADGPVLDRLLLARWSDGRPLDDEEVASQILALIVAGNETTASVVAFAVRWLLMNRPILEALRDALDALGPEPSADALAAVPLLQAVCAETLRLSPPTWSVENRRLRRPLDLGDHVLPAGTRVTVSPVLVGRDAGLYRDPERFDPSRFLALSPPPHEQPAFGGGLRLCPGLWLATLEMRLLLAELVRQRDLTPVRRTRPMRAGLVVVPSHGMPVRARPRVRA